MKTALLITFVSLMSSSLTMAQYGALDMTFGDEGKVSTAFGNYRSAVKALAVQPDGKIVAAGSTFNSGSYHRFALARYLPDGSLDLTFGDEGRVIGDYPSERMELNSVVIQSDGKILATGIIYNQYFNSDFLMARFNADGTPDVEFGSQGIIVQTGMTISSVKVQNDGRIVVAGNTYNPSGAERHITVLRFNTDGTADTSFGQNGQFIASVGLRNFANSLALLPDGKIVVGGALFNGNFSDFCVLRLMADGTPDMDFGVQGFASFDYDYNDEITSVCAQADGKLIFSGYTGDENNVYSYALMRINQNGSVDHGFGNDGLITGDGGSMAKSVEVESSGKIVVAGAYDNGSSKWASLQRFNSDGTQDITFGENGLITTSFSSSCQANAMTIQPDGKILLGGEAGVVTTGYNPDFAVMRYTSGTQLHVGAHDGQKGMVKVYPNPVSDRFNIETNLFNAEKLSVTLSDIHGRTVHRFGISEFGAGVTTKELALPQGLTQGTYFLNLSGASGNMVVRIIN